MAVMAVAEAPQGGSAPRNGMLTGELKNQVDRIWDTFWAGGIANPLEVMEQITYLLFLRRLDDLQTLILLANSVTLSQARHERDEGGLARLGSGDTGEPGTDPQEVDRDGGQDVPKVRLGQADVAGAAEAAHSDAL